VMGDGVPGVFASLDPRLMAVTPIGVTGATASRYCAEARACGLNVAADRMGSRRMAPYSRLGASSVERVFQPVRPNGEGETACGYRANLSQEHAPRGATEMSRESSEATPPVIRPPDAHRHPEGVGEDVVGAIDVGRNGPARRIGPSCCAGARACGSDVAADRMGSRRERRAPGGDDRWGWRAWV